MVWLQTDLGYYATRKMLESSNMIVGDMQASKGRLDFRFKDAKDVIFQVTTKQKLGIYFPEEVGYKIFLERVKPFLAKADGTQAQIITVISEPNSVLKIEEADRDDVLGHLRILKQDQDPDILAFRLKKLDALARGKRIAHLPEMLSFIEGAFKEPKYGHKNVPVKLISLTNAMLSYERIYKPANHREIVGRIQEASLQSIVRILGRETDYDVLYQIISLLKNTDREASVDALFRLIERLSDDLYKRLKQPIFEVLFRPDSTLKNAQKERIDREIDKLLSSTNPKTKARGREISEYAY